MKTINKYFFVVGDIFLPRLSRLTVRMLEEHGVVVKEKERVGIHNLGTTLLTGDLSGHDYFLQLKFLVNAKFPLGENDLFKSLSLNSGALSVVDALGRNNEVILFSDFPKPWLTKISQIGCLIDHFQQVIYSQEINCNNLREDVFDRLMATHEIQAGNSLWVDSDPFRTSIAIRRSIDSIIYVDKRRLLRELNLRSLL